jgi:FAD synthase
LRAEHKFNSIDDLKSQIKSDVARAEKYFEHSGVKRMLSVV